MYCSPVTSIPSHSVKGSIADNQQYLLSLHVL